MLLKCCTQYVNKSGKLISSHKTGKYQFSFQSQRKAMPKNVQTTLQLCSLHMPANLENSAVATGLEKVSFHSNPKERQCWRMLKLLHNCTHLTSSKVMLKILQARLQQYVNHEIPDVQAGFRKGRGTRDQIASIRWIIKKGREFQKTSISALLTMPKPLTVWITINCGKFWERWEHQTTWPASWEICMQVRKQPLELHMEQQTGSK